MVDSAQINLVKKLYGLTKSSRLKWEVVVSRTNDQYQVSISDVTVRIRESQNSSGAPDYIVSIVDGYGNTIDTFSDVELRNEQGWTDAYPVMKELFRDAVRAASGADKIIKSLLDNLDRLSE